MDKQFITILNSIYKINNTVAEITKPIRTISNILNPIHEYISKLSKVLDDLPIRTKIVLMSLANEGWFINIKIPFSELWKLNQLIEENNIDLLEEYFIMYFEENLEQIEENITSSFPNRADILKSAFNAHKNKEYNLSIPVLLAQTDGIFNELTNTYFFMQKYKRKNFVEQFAIASYRNIFLTPFSKNLPIDITENKRDITFNQLNRHMVLHGESLDYGTQVNSLKVISLLNYIILILKEEDVDTSS